MKRPDRKSAAAGVVLGPQELAWLQTPPSAFPLHGNTCTCGTGLLASYAISDTVQALAGEHKLQYL